MSMLAEKKRRTQWCLNPMGNLWAKDENKFGQKMLEKMGWSPGKGLGVNCQGNTDIIKMNVKNDTLGLGSKKEDKKEMWTKQLVDFNSLLSELNGEANKDEKETINIQSLEEKSKTSRVRVHYHKFTRGKDVSKYSSKDLNSILPLNQIEEDNKEESSQNNMYAYFSKKANNPYRYLESLDSQDNTQENILREEEVPSQDILSKDNNKKKKKKRKHLDPEHKDTSDNPKEPEILGESVSKKKKTKLADNEEINIEVDESFVNYDSNEIENHGNNVCSYENEQSDNVPKKKKRKKKKKNKKESEIIDSS